MFLEMWSPYNPYFMGCAIFGGWVNRQLWNNEFYIHNFIQLVLTLIRIAGLDVASMSCCLIVPSPSNCVQVSAMLPSWSYLSWTSTTSWSWPGDSTTSFSAFSPSSLGQNATNPGTRRTASRTQSAGTRPSGWRPTLPTLLPLSQSSGSEYSQTHVTRLKRTLALYLAWVNKFGQEGSILARLIFAKVPPFLWIYFKLYLHCNVYAQSLTYVMGLK